MKFIVLPQRVIEKGLFVIGDDGQIKDLPPHIIISITAPGDADAKIEHPDSLKGILRLKFWDITNLEKYTAPDLDITEEDRQKYLRDLFDEGDAKAVCNFVRKHMADVELIICHCHAGVSRSAGVVAALSKVITGDDEQFFKPPYKPNMLVYRLVHDTWLSSAVRPSTEV